VFDFEVLFVLCGDGFAQSFPIPCLGCGLGWFFGLGLFLGCVGMGGRFGGMLDGMG
jgi:hypothetical protein